MLDLLEQMFYNNYTEKALLGIPGRFFLCTLTIAIYVGRLPRPDSFSEEHSFLIRFFRITKPAPARGYCPTGRLRSGKAGKSFRKGQQSKSGLKSFVTPRIKC
jgi:hypothetical protein